MEKILRLVIAVLRFHPDKVFFGQSRFQRLLNGNSPFEKIV